MKGEKWTEINEMGGGIMHPPVKWQARSLALTHSLTINQSFPACRLGCSNPETGWLESALNKHAQLKKGKANSFPVR